jgi:AcrR family transcriptional regulator
MSMRYTPDHKDAVRARLVASAAKIVRRGGIAGVSVARVMSTARMTVGGFYRHFGSQDDLVADALVTAMRDARARLFDGLAELRGRRFEAALVERYLSDAHFENLEHGCPIAATLGELPRASRKARGPILGEVRSLIDFTAERLGTDRDPHARAWMVFCACAGALALGRAIGGSEGRALIGAVRRELTKGGTDG